MEVPEAFYNCTSEGCRSEVTYPAAMLNWWDGKAIEPDPTDPEDTAELPAAVHKEAGWYCDYCVEHFAARTSQNLQLLIESVEAGRGEPNTGRGATATRRAEAERE